MPSADGCVNNPIYRSHLMDFSKFGVYACFKNIREMRVLTYVKFACN